MKQQNIDCFCHSKTDANKVKAGYCRNHNGNNKSNWIFLFLFYYIFLDIHPPAGD
jgi:hypothetical protein